MADNVAPLPGLTSGVDLDPGPLQRHSTGCIKALEKEPPPLAVSSMPRR